MIEEILRNAIWSAADSLGISATNFTLEHPNELSHGDYSTNIALIAAREMQANPKDLAERIRQAMHANLPEEVSRTDVAGPGFINFYLKPSFFTNQLSHALQKNTDWGRNVFLEGNKVIVEYTDPNPFKEMHIGHLMSNTIGESVSRLVEFSGAQVKRVTYQGDVGPHIAKAIWGLRSLGIEPAVENIGKAYATGNRAYEEREDAKAEMDALNRALYEGSDQALMALYAKGKEVSLNAFNRMYEKLGSSFDRFFFESESSREGLRLVAEGLERGVFEMSDGAVVYRGEKRGLHTRVFKTSQGTPTYEAKELGLEPLKQSWWPHDVSIIMTANEQREYFKVVLAAMAELLPDDALRIRHIAHGFLRLPEGKMSSRTGNVVTASSLIEEVEKSAREKTDDPALAGYVAVAAIKYEILKQRAGSDIVFDIKKSLSLEGDSGPYLQYAHTRACSLLAKARESGSRSSVESPPQNIPELAKHLYRFPEVVRRAHAECEPHHVTTFLTDLASTFNTWYAAERVIGSPDESYKLALVEAFAVTMKNGLWLLGIAAPEKM